MKPEPSLVLSEPRRKLFRPGPTAALLAATGLAFLPSITGGLVWDDAHLLTPSNPFLQPTFDALPAMFSRPFAGHYQPLTWLSYWLDARLWNLQVFALHAVNIVLHAATTLGFLHVARRLISVAGTSLPPDAARFGALVAAMLFALHPLRVESVAWITERRDVLSGALLMASTLAYLRYTERGGRRFLALSVAVYALSLMAKATGMTWPVVLLILDLNPLRRTMASPGRSGLKFAALLLEKVPFAILAAGAAGMALWAQRASGALWTLDVHPLSLRIAQSFYGLIFYIGKAVWPSPLLPLYEQPPFASATEPAYVLAGVGVVMLTLAAIALRRRASWFGVCWIVYVVIASPMLGIAQSGPQVAADRYTYVAMLPWAVALGAAAAGLWTRAGRAPDAAGRGMPRGRARLVLAVAVLGAMMMALSMRQSTVWLNERALWEHVVGHAPKTGLARVNLAKVLLGDGDCPAAELEALAAMEILPANAGARVTLGLALACLDDFAGAEAALLEAIRLFEADPSGQGSKRAEAPRYYLELVRQRRRIVEPAASGEPGEGSSPSGAGH